MSLKVIKINELGENITVDSTLISVDSTLITVDMTAQFSGIYTLKLPYRFFSSNIKMYLWNEIKETETILELEVVEDGGTMIVDFFIEFEDGETFEVRITDLDDKLIWRGKILATLQDDLENYILHKNDNGIIKI
jgi:hypothetical protein